MDWRSTPSTGLTLDPAPCPEITTPSLTYTYIINDSCYKKVVDIDTSRLVDIDNRPDVSVVTLLSTSPKCRSIQNWWQGRTLCSYSSANIDTGGGGGIGYTWYEGLNELGIGILCA